MSIKKILWMTCWIERGMVRIVLLRFFVKHWLNTQLLVSQFQYSKGSVWLISVINNSLRSRDDKSWLLYFVVKHRQYIVLLGHRLNFSSDWSWWVSARVNRKRNDANCITLFCCRALNRYCVPSGPKELTFRLSVMAVYEWGIKSIVE